MLACCGSSRSTITRTALTSYQVFIPLLPHNFFLIIYTATFHTFHLYRVTWVCVLEDAWLAAAVGIRGDHACTVNISTGQATNNAAFSKALAVCGAPPAVYHRSCVKLCPWALVPGHGQVAGTAVQVQHDVLRNTWYWRKAQYRNWK